MCVAKSRHRFLRRFVSIMRRRGPSTIIVTKSLCSHSMPPASTMRLLGRVLFGVGMRLGAPIITVKKGRSDTRELSFNDS